MTLEYVLLVGVIGVPIAVILLKMMKVLALLYEISDTLWMLPI